MIAAHAFEYASDLECESRTLRGLPERPRSTSDGSARELPRRTSRLRTGRLPVPEGIVYSARIPASACSRHTLGRRCSASPYSANPGEACAGRLDLACERNAD